ncbi:hypothetical protein SLS62_010125 [Diatrype stigma]|uniref:Potassium channel domain-containing protein n=1 Tax=Diatrype stigma TaxID=117547 RepID=A0AAN9UD51_9PEZI
MDDAGLGENIQEQSQAIDKDEPNTAINNDHMHLDPTRWWFASAAFPMIAGTLGPVASAFSILSLVEKWRQHIPPGSDMNGAEFIEDPAWLIIVNAVQLAIAVVANLFLLLNMTKKVRFSIAQPVTIVGWYISAVCLVALAATASGPLVPADDIVWIWSQAFYYGVYAAVLYFIVASLMVITVMGARAGHYGKDFELTMSQRTLMLQTLAFLVYLLVGALIFSHIENWKYLDGIYWADVTLFTVGYGDYSPSTTLGRALLMPYALVGVTSLGLVIGSIRTLALDRGKRRLDVRMLEKKRRQLIRRIARKGDEGILEPIAGEVFDAYPSSKDHQNIPQAELERRRKEFLLMRKIQNKASIRRRWTAMAVSTSTWLLLWLVGAGIFQACEKPYQGWSYFDGVYFAYTALTTIGYGDITPVSNGAKSFFVLWSLIALPTMTVFISNAGDTIVKIIRDGTLRLGNLTILPGDSGIKKETKQLLARLSFGVLFADEDIEESPPGFLGAAQPTMEDEDSDDSKEDEEDVTTSKGQRKAYGNEHRRNRIHSGVASQYQNEINQPKSSKSTSQDLDSSEQRDMPVELPKSRPEYHLLLIDEIGRVTRHLQSSPPRKYTYKEWAWFLRLLGEDESNAETHQRAMRRPRDEGHHVEPGQPGPSKDDPEPAAEGNASEQQISKWSWVGHRSPLMDSREEAEWILDRLEQKLREELQSVVKEQQGDSGVREVRSEEDRNEQKPLKPTPMQ